MIPNRCREFLEQPREASYMIRMGMRKPIRANRQLPALEKPHNLFTFATRINNNRHILPPDNDTICRVESTTNFPSETLKCSLDKSSAMINKRIRWNNIDRNNLHLKPPPHCTAPLIG